MVVASSTTISTVGTQTFFLRYPAHGMDADHHSSPRPASAGAPRPCPVRTGYVEALRARGVLGSVLGGVRRGGAAGPRLIEASSACLRGNPCPLGYRRDSARVKGAHSPRS
ncbi:hypothetical protein YT1_p10109 (plasmid) [Rhodococcus ruber]|nr:hypothetical protein YT1_p10109 [Rhodococcus ruber]